MINLAKLAYPVTALGPGKRLALWTAGCPLSCKGCISPELLSAESGQKIAVPDLVQHITKIKGTFAGLSLSGGEPFVQASTLASLCEQLLNNFPDWNILAFSGYPLVYLQRHPQYHPLLAKINILIAGPYVVEQAIAHPLIGSANQQIHYLNDPQQTLKSAIESLPLQQVNIGLSQNNTHSIIGILAPDNRALLHQQLSKR